MEGLQETKAREAQQQGGAQNQYYHLITEALQDFDRYFPLTGEWKKCEDKKDFTTHIRWFEQQKISAARAEIVIQRPPETVVAFFQDPSHRSVLQSNVTRNESLQKFTQDCAIWYSVYSGKLGFSDREVVNIQDFVHRDGAVYFVQKSADYAAPPPAKKDTVRIDMFFSIYRIEGVPEGSNATATKLSFLHLADPKISLPNFMKDLGVKAQAAGITLIKKHLEKQNK